MKQTRSDRIFVTALLFLGVGLSLWIYLPHKESGSQLEIRIDGETVSCYSLNEDRQETLTCKDGTNTVIIQDGVVTMTEADCPDHVCVGMHGISQAGETIVCLPHRLVLAIVSDSQSPSVQNEEDGETLVPDAVTR